MTRNIEERSKKIWMGSFIVLASLLTLTMIFFSSMFTGNAVFKIPSAYNPGDDLDDDIYLPNPINSTNPTNPVSLINNTNNTYTYNYSYNGSKVLVTPDMTIEEICVGLDSSLISSEETERYLYLCEKYFGKGGEYEDLEIYEGCIKNKEDRTKMYYLFGFDDAKPKMAIDNIASWFKKLARILFGGITSSNCPQGQTFCTCKNGIFAGCQADCNAYCASLGF